MLKVEGVQEFENIRKFSRRFKDLKVFADFLRSDYATFIQQYAGEGEQKHFYKEYVSQALTEAEGMLKQLERMLSFASFFDGLQLKIKVYLADLILTYLRDQSANFLKDLDNEIYYLMEQQNTRDHYDYYIEVGYEESKAEELAKREAQKAFETYSILQYIGLPYMKEFRNLARDAYYEFADNYFILYGLSEESLQIDAVIERVGDLLHLPEEYFQNVLDTAKFGYKSDDKHKELTEPTLTADQIMILFDALKTKKGISPDVDKAALGYHLDRITSYSFKRLSQGFSKIRKFYECQKYGEDSYDAHAVIRFLKDHVIKYIEEEIKAVRRRI